MKPPSTGATIGATLDSVMNSEKSRAAATPLETSAAIARAKTIPPPPAAPGVVVRRLLAVEPLVAIVDHGHPLAGAERTDLAALAALTPFVEMRAESGLRRQVDAAFERAGAIRQIAFELSTSESVVRYVGLGFGAAVVPLSAVGTDVRALILPDARARHPVSLIHRQPEPAAPSARAFVAMLTSGPVVASSKDSAAEQVSTTSGSGRAAARRIRSEG